MQNISKTIIEEKENLKTNYIEHKYSSENIIRKFENDVNIIIIFL